MGQDEYSFEGFWNQPMNVELGRYRDIGCPQIRFGGVDAEYRGFHGIPQFPSPIMARQTWRSDGISRHEMNKRRDISELTLPGESGPGSGVRLAMR